ncbi:MAG: DUF3616 domain-containing protein, partial [Planctomycetota bacterium]|nr:DUF3616 domain-containing protein [Planctomycetota bacterium]
MKMWTANYLVMALIVVSLSACDRTKKAGKISVIHRIELQGEIEEAEDISAIALLKSGMFIGADERGSIQFLKKKSDKVYELQKTTVLSKDQEIDIEALTTGPNTVYVLGSHSFKRSKVKDSKKYAKNRKRLSEVEAEPSRDAIYQLTIDENGQSSNVKKVGLRKILNKDKYLSLFTEIPSKENGIDIEGLAYHKGKLYAGFRGPVLRGNHAVVLIFNFSKVDDYKLHFVNLDGHGIRDIQRVKKGFLILSGPVGDARESGRLYFWDGQDGVIGKDRPITPAKFLGHMPGPAGSKAEGLAVQEETGDAYKVVIVY